MLLSQAHSSHAALEKTEWYAVKERLVKQEARLIKQVGVC
jgi:hypothetical protein